MKHSSSFAAFLITVFIVSDEFGVQKHSCCLSFFLSSLSHRGKILPRYPHQSKILWARPPPISNFDLESIEAYEATVDFEDQSDSTDDEDSLLDEDDSARIFSIPDDLDGKRIDAALAAIMEPKLSRSACGNVVAGGYVHQIKLKQGKEVEVLLNRKSFKVESGMMLRVSLPRKEIPDQIMQQNIPLKIIYEDEHMIVINKDAGMVVHPATGNWDGTVVNALAYYLANDSAYGIGDFVSDVDPDNLSTLRPGIVHRLDKGTTGILIVSKTNEALAKLSAAFAERKVKKTYLAITVGNPGNRVTIDKPIGRHPIHRQRMRVVPDRNRKESIIVAHNENQRSPSQSGRRALSFVDTLQFDGKLSLVQVRIATGRTHQIRVHLQDRRTPIYGDDVYGIADWNKRLLRAHGIERPLLHAHKLEIHHPISRELMTFVAPMAPDMVSVAKKIWPDGENKLPGAFMEES